MSKADVSFLPTAKDEPDRIKYRLEYEESELPKQANGFFASLAEQHPSLHMDSKKSKKGFLFFKKKVQLFFIEGEQKRVDHVVKEFQTAIS